MTHKLGVTDVSDIPLVAARLKCSEIPIAI